MKRLAEFAALTVAFTASMSTAHEVPQTADLQKPEIQTLMSTALDSADGLEVIVSHVALPANVTLPNHWHPGEEFAYVLQGSVTLILQGESEKEISEGETGFVPLKKIHTARSGDEGAKIIVFRVHEEGQPGRTLVDQ